jgi:hypothetical protein
MDSGGYTSINTPAKVIDHHRFGCDSGTQAFIFICIGAGACGLKVELINISHPMSHGMITDSANS